MESEFEEVRQLLSHDLVGRDSDGDIEGSVPRAWGLKQLDRGRIPLKARSWQSAVPETVFRTDFLLRTVLARAEAAALFCGRKIPREVNLRVLIPFENLRKFKPVEDRHVRVLAEELLFHFKAWTTQASREGFSAEAPGQSYFVREPWSRIQRIAWGRDQCEKALRLLREYGVTSYQETLLKARIALEYAYSAAALSEILLEKHPDDQSLEGLWGRVDALLAYRKEHPLRPTLRLAA